MRVTSAYALHNRFMPRQVLTAKDLPLALERYLSRYPSSERRASAYLRRLCRRHGVEDSAAAIEAALARARALGLLNDALLSQALVASGPGRGDSRRRLQVRARQRELDPVLPGLADYDEWEALLRFVRKRRLESAWAAAEDRSARDKVLAKALRAGFPLPLVQRWKTTLDAT